MSANSVDSCNPSLIRKHFLAWVRKQLFLLLLCVGTALTVLIGGYGVGRMVMGTGFEAMDTTLPFMATLQAKPFPNTMDLVVCANGIVIMVVIAFIAMVIWLLGRDLCSFSKKREASK